MANGNIDIFLQCIEFGLFRMDYELRTHSTNASQVFGWTLKVQIMAFLAPTGAQEVTMSFCPVLVCLELSFFIFLTQISLRSLLGLS